MGRDVAQNRSVAIDETTRLIGSMRLHLQLTNHVYGRCYPNASMDPSWYGRFMRSDAARTSV